MSGRLFLLSALVVGGALSCVWLGASLGLAVLALCVALVLALVLRSSAVIYIAAAAVGLNMGALRVLSLQDAPILKHSGSKVSVVAEVVAPARRIGDSTHVRVAVVSIDDVLADFGRVGLKIEPSIDLEVGDRINAQGVKILGRAPPRFWDRVERLQQRVSALGYADSARVVVEPQAGSLLRRIAGKGRQTARLVADGLRNPAAGLLLGVTIGDVSRIDGKLSDDFRATGLTHLVAVSGSNIALVLAMLGIGLRAVRAHRVLRVAAMSIAILSFSAISAFEPSVLRAGVMAAVALGAGWFGFARRATSLLGTTLLIWSVADPFLFFSIGFQLSVLATLGLLFLGRRFAGAEPTPMRAAAAAALGAHLATLPLIAWTFGEVSLIAVAANLIAAPIIAPVTLIGAAVMIASAATPAVAVLAKVLELPLLALSQVSATLADVPMATVHIPKDLAGIAVVLALLVLAFAASRAGLRGRTVLTLTLLVPSAAAAFGACSKPPQLEGLTITMLDVGQGDAILVTLDNHALLVDGGSSEDKAARMLARRGIKRLDYAVISHAHDDHVSGLVGVFERMPVGTLLDPDLDDDLRDYQRIKQLAEDAQTPRIAARTGQVYPFGEAQIEVLWPAEPLLEGTDSDLNENSIVMRISYGSDAILLAGETQEQAQAKLLQRSPRSLRAEILKVSHHGSGRMLPEFYQATGAEIALIPVGKNSYGHPHPATLAALGGMRILRSDFHGTVEASVDGGDSVSFQTER